MHTSGGTLIQNEEDIIKWHEHIQYAKDERIQYKSDILIVKQSIQALGSLNNIAPNTTANTTNLILHFSFDYAQYVQIPHLVQQEVNIYFKTPIKVQVFGVCNDAIPQQVIFLNEEKYFVGKGSDAVISQIHFYLANYGYGAQEIILHTDNCSGQNKNNALIKYLVGE
ncbi:hypothetical protein BC936DRAFT_142229 [Jimgerdemannia flammicorona]|uniref:Uncharacterized protein n=1 Tax=Jimgerdemannia flammicorona TaxID=994334 RepID=A0A433A137_9FUNG|nr:hypothetical protein BC936DRAFT_142229 [Jimgerdemannia flammicorona]